MARTTTRLTQLRQGLVDRRREIQSALGTRVRDGRSDRSVDGDDLEHSEADTQSDIELALLQIKAETLLGIDAALVRLDAGKYGTCFECAKDIPDRRLKALPFAVRCQDCERRREQAKAEELAASRAGRHLATSY